MEHAVRNKTAILVFVRGAKEEARQKRFVSAAGSVTNRRIAESLNERVIHLARETGLPTYIISSDQQVGNTFGARFTHALKTVFDRGHQYVIAVGNDCLTLSSRHLKEAATSIERHSFVLGPSFDGGAYVIGVDRRYFEATAFEALPWQQPILLEALFAYSVGFGKIPHLLTREWDADDPHSFASSLAGLPAGSPLRTILPALLPLDAPANFFYSPAKHRNHHGPPPLRGPPPAGSDFVVGT